MKVCENCGSTEKLTDHHIEGSDKARKIYLCQSCHDSEHGIKRKEDVKSLGRRIRRAKRRIERDKKIVEQTEAQLMVKKRE